MPNPSNFIVYKASAGSGKTYTLAAEYIAQLLISPENSHAYQNILAVTFTKDATNEMKSRILQELYGLAKGLSSSRGFQKKVNGIIGNIDDKDIQSSAKTALSNLLHDYSRFNVVTIDSFFQRVLRNLAHELGAGSKFNIEMNTDKVLEDAVRKLIIDLEPHSQLLNNIETFISDKMENASSINIKRELTDFGKKLFDETYQAEEDDLSTCLKNNSNPLIVLKANHKKICDEFERDMDSFVLRSKKDLPKVNVITKYFERIANKEYKEEKLIGKKLGDFIKNKNSGYPLFEETENYRTANIKSYNTSKLILKNINQFSLLQSIGEVISDQNKENNRFLLPETASFLSKMIQDADASFVYEKIGAEIHHVMIDEFQDTSKLQWKNFKSLLTDIAAINAFSLIVGDVKQSIYRWRNGDWRIMNSELQNTFNIKEETLRDNFRSSKSVVSFNNDFFSSAGKFLNGRLEELKGKDHSDLIKDKELNDYMSVYEENNVTQSVVKKEINGFASVDVIAKPKGDKRDYYITALILRIIDAQKAGVLAKNICILCRKNNQIKDIANAFSKIKQSDSALEQYELADKELDFDKLREGNYLDIISNEAFMLSASPLINLIVNALMMVDNWQNKVSKANTLFFWSQLKKKSINYHDTLSNCETDDKKLPTGFRQENIKNLQSMSLYELVMYIYKAFALQDAAKDQTAYFYTFLDYLLAYLQQNTSDIKGFLDYWDETLSKKTIPTGEQMDGIRISTIHKSKGLQYHTVMVPYCTGDMSKNATQLADKFVWCKCKNNVPPIFPITYNKEMENSNFMKEYEEETMMNWMDELNTLYVAFTRAENNLFVFTEPKSESGNTFTQQVLINNVLKENLSEENNITEEGSKRYVLGVLEPSKEQEEKREENLLKQKYEIENGTTLQVGKGLQDACTFRQSNESTRFVNEEPDSQDYIQQGNVMHDLFANIGTTEDVEKAIDNLVFKGVIDKDKKEEYEKKITEALNVVKDKNWFSGKYTLHNECSIISHDEEGKTVTFRPDRVMTGSNEIVVLDYKFGKQNAEHQEQVKNYMNLLSQMVHKNVQGYLWYVNSNNLISVN